MKRIVIWILCLVVGCYIGSSIIGVCHSVYGKTIIKGFHAGVQHQQDINFKDLNLYCVRSLQGDDKDAYYLIYKTDEDIYNRFQLDGHMFISQYDIKYDELRGIISREIEWYVEHRGNKGYITIMRED